jgi:uncharacterized membrane protein (UPF0127 family)
MRTLAGLGLATAVALASCSLLPAGEGEARAEKPALAPRHPVSGLPVVPLTIAANGKTLRLRVEVARTGAEQAQGLMFRTAMAADEGMIFPMEPPRQASFWMKNTVIPLDLVFIDGNGRIESIAANAVPYSLDPINSRGTVAAVLEINGGRASQLGLAPGDRVAWSLAPARIAP